MYASGCGESKTADNYAGTLSSSKAVCRALTASSIYFSSRTTEVFIAEVAVICMYTFARARV